MRRHKVSERRACKLLEQNRSTQRYVAVSPPEELKLIAAMNALAQKHPRWGYRSITRLLQNDGWKVNPKSGSSNASGDWRPPRPTPSKSKKSGKKATGTGDNSSVNQPAEAGNHIWSYDFVSARVRRGGPIRILNVVDEFTRVSLGSKVARSIGAHSVVAHLENLFDTYGKPVGIRSDNGREFISDTVVKWLTDHNVEPIFIERRAARSQNPFVERFNGTMRRDLLNLEDFNNVTEARGS